MFAEEMLRLEWLHPISFFLVCLVHHQKRLQNGLIVRFVRSCATLWDQQRKELGWRKFFFDLFDLLLQGNQGQLVSLGYVGVVGYNHKLAFDIALLNHHFEMRACVMEQRLCQRVRAFCYPLAKEAFVQVYVHHQGDMFGLFKCEALFDQLLVMCLPK
jgi:hypothetical protein